VGDVAYEIVEAKRWHCGRLARAICWERWLAFIEGGFRPHDQLVQVFEISAIRRTALIDGAPVAMWGVTGTLLSREGGGWLSLTKAAMAHPFALAREVRAQLAEISATRQIRIGVAQDDSAAVRFATFFGFKREGEPLRLPDSGLWMVPMRFGG